jgi:L-asparagine oxygenase
VLQDASAEYRDVFERLAGRFEVAMRRVVVRPGDLLVLDNDLVVHGRDSFIAGFDGRDRWLKRVIVRLPGRGRPAPSVGETGYGEVLSEPFGDGSGGFGSTGS